MPYKLRKLPNKNLYRVYNPKTKVIHAMGTTKAKAKAQVRILNSIRQK